MKSYPAYFLQLVMIALCLAALPVKANAKGTLVADLDQSEVGITTDFNGTELLLFGALSKNSNDQIVIVISGPAKSMALRRKGKVAGIWLNTENARLEGIPSFYHVLSTKPVDEIATPEERQKIRLGYEHIPLKLAAGSRIDEGELNEWKDALTRNMEQAELWDQHPGSIKVIEGVLFRTNVILPANVIPGQYEVRVMHFSNGVMVNEDISMLKVAKSGLSAMVYNIAHDYAPFYGIFAIIFAVAAGWLAAVAFRR
ncbi:MAG: hypothetical protein EBZ18_00060 [Alphaproteobacteria bacterium]|jgi:uncharacterized protein (TIGR02186 family)|nr:hypothetical protein [Alphaproteobacteria bacterium]